MPSDRRIAVIGLGYVGLPVAVAFARAECPVIGFDIDAERVEELRAGHDRTREVDAARSAQSESDAHHRSGGAAKADFFIVTVPTPIDDARRPDLTALLGASETVGRALKQRRHRRLRVRRSIPARPRKSASRCWKRRRA